MSYHHARKSVPRNAIWGAVMSDRCGFALEVFAVALTQEEETADLETIYVGVKGGEYRLRKSGRRVYGGNR